MSAHAGGHEGIERPVSGPTLGVPLPHSTNGEKHAVFTNCLLKASHVLSCPTGLCGAERNLPVWISGEVKEWWLLVPEELLFLRKNNNEVQNTPLSGEGIIY